MADHYHMNLTINLLNQNISLTAGLLKLIMKCDKCLKGSLYIQKKDFMPVLMDFIANDDQLFYCLPIGDNTMLFETTYFTTAQKDN